MLPICNSNSLKQVAITIAKEVTKHNSTKQVIRPLALRGISMAESYLSIESPKIIEKKLGRYHVGFVDTMTKEKKFVQIPQIFLNNSGNPLYIDDNTLKDSISRYLKIQNKCKIPSVLDQFLALDKDSLRTYDFSKLNGIFYSPVKTNLTFYRGIRQLDEGKSIALNSFLASKLCGTSDCPSGNGLTIGFISNSFLEANEYSNQNSVVLEFRAVSDKNQKVGPYGGVEYTSFKDIIKDGVYLHSIHKGSGEYSNKSAFSTIYD